MKKFSDYSALIAATLIVLLSNTVSVYAKGGDVDVYELPKATWVSRLSIYGFQTDCCGGSLSVTQTELALEMSEAILQNAKKCGAEALITMCPMCHMNLDARQADMKAEFGIPIFHSTQLTTLAFGLDVKDSHFNKNIVDPLPLLKSKGLV